MNKIVDYFVLLLVVAAIVGFALAYYFVTPAEPPLPTIIVYSSLAVSLCVLAVGHVVLLRRERSDTAPFWLVSITYALSAFAFGLMTVVAVVGTRLIFPAYLADWMVRFAYGTLGASGAALAFGAFAFLIGMQKRIMRSRVFATPWAAIKHLLKKPE